MLQRHILELVEQVVCKAVLLTLVDVVMTFLRMKPRALLLLLMILSAWFFQASFWSSGVIYIGAMEGYTCSPMVLSDSRLLDPLKIVYTSLVYTMLIPGFYDVT